MTSTSPTTRKTSLGNQAKATRNGPSVWNISLTLKLFLQSLSRRHKNLIELLAHQVLLIKDTSLILMLIQWVRISTVRNFIWVYIRRLWEISKCRAGLIGRMERAKQRMWMSKSSMGTQGCSWWRLFQTSIDATATSRKYEDVWTVLWGVKKMVKRCVATMLTTPCISWCAYGDISWLCYLRKDTISATQMFSW